MLILFVLPSFEASQAANIGGSLLNTSIILGKFGHKKFLSSRLIFDSWSFGNLCLLLTINDAMGNLTGFAKIGGTFCICTQNIRLRTARYAPQKEFGQVFSWDIIFWELRMGWFLKPKLPKFIKSGLFSENRQQTPSLVQTPKLQIHAVHAWLGQIVSIWAPLCFLSFFTKLWGDSFVEVIRFVMLSFKLTAETFQWKFKIFFFAEHYRNHSTYPKSGCKCQSLPQVIPRYFFHVFYLNLWKAWVIKITQLFIEAQAWETLRGYISIPPDLLYDKKVPFSSRKCLFGALKNWSLQMLYPTSMKDASYIPGANTFQECGAI